MGNMSVLCIKCTTKCLEMLIPRAFLTSTRSKDHGQRKNGMWKAKNTEKHSKTGKMLVQGRGGARSGQNLVFLTSESDSPLKNTGYIFCAIQSDYPFAFLTPVRISYGQRYVRPDGGPDAQM